MRSALAAIRALTHLDMEFLPPCWIGGRGSDPRSTLAMRNGILDLATGTLTPATPDFFTVNPLPYDYDPEAAEPREWLRCLGEYWPDSPSSITCVQEWFGYLLTPDTRLDGSVSV